jgi:hypothetical protein
MKTHYGKSKNKCRTLKVHQEFFYFLKAIFLITLAGLSEFELKSQDNNITKKESVPSVYETLPMRFVVEELGNFYLDVIYPDNELLYVPVCDLFRTLKIQCIEGEEGDSIGGFIEREKNTYLIDYNLKRIKVGEKTINISKGLIKDMGIIYLESSLFSEAFGLTLIFNSRTLSVQVKSGFELPIIKQQRIEKLQSNISKIKGEVITDTLLLRNYHLFKFGIVDWSVTSIQAKMQSADNRINLGIGTELLYGEANLSVNYSSQNNFDTRQFQYLWHWVDNDRKIIRQAQIGKIYNQTIAFINAPVIGTSIRNTPTTLRKATGYYVINEFTEPDWNVELYINNVLVDFTKADATGLYVFKVPIVYGYTTLKLKFYGPMGEERTDERIINVPYTIMPTNEFEYGISGGFVADSVWSRYGKGEFNYGVNRFLTVGGGLEYLSSISNGPFIPYASATIQPLSKLTINVQYAYKVRSFLTLNYYFGKNSSLGLDYKKYYEGQLATIFSAPEERKIKVSIPYKILKIRGYARLDLTQLVYSDFTNNQGNLMVSGYLKQLSINSSTQFNWIDQKAPYITSDLALSYRLKRGYIIRPSTQYNAKERKFTMIRADIEKRIPKGFFSISYQKNFSNNENYISINLRFDLSFARANISSSYSNGSLATAESVQGSLAFGGDNYIHASNNSSAGKGGIVLYPFLDLNQNGILDSGEHLVKINNVKTTGSRAIFNKNDSIVRIPDLNAFVNYTIEFEDRELDNMAWRFKKKTYSILVDPNQFKRVDVPIIVVGEVSGMVFIDRNNTLKGIGRIRIKFYERNSNMLVAETLSESDGYIYYMGLRPGEYVARIDSAQLSKLNFIVDLQEKNFTIKSLEEGDIIEGIDFIMTDKEIIERKENRDIIIVYKVQILSSTISKKKFQITVKNKIYDTGEYYYLKAYRETVGEFSSYKQALGLQNDLRKSGYSQAFVIVFKNNVRTLDNSLLSF